MYKPLFLLFILFSFHVSGNCSKYYFSLDFGGRVGDGLEITDYLVEQNVPHVVFMVGNNLKTQAAKDLCYKVNTDSKYAKFVKIGNHTQNHRGFEKLDSKSYIRSEILGNENQIKSLCTKKNFVRVFRYPKGQSHQYAEKILKENNYTSNYSRFSQSEFRTKTGVGWTSDTRDWIREGAASIWAQKTYALKNKNFLPVIKSSAKDFQKYIEKLPVSSTLKEIYKNKKIEIYKKGIHQEVVGLHGPSQSFIEDKILNDKGVDGVCVPLTHFGGFNTLAALKVIIPKLKKKGKEFALMSDELNITKAILTLEKPEKLEPKIETKCVNFDSTKSYTIISEGDTLFKIARENGISVEDIKKYNNLISDEIEIGQKIYLEAIGRKHIVKKGETLFSISQNYDIDINEIKKANGLKSDNLEIGQELIL